MFKTVYSHRRRIHNHVLHGIVLINEICLERAIYFICSFKRMLEEISFWLVWPIFSKTDHLVPRSPNYRKTKDWAAVTSPIRSPVALSKSKNVRYFECLTHTVWWIWVIFTFLYISRKTSLPFFVLTWWLCCELSGDKAAVKVNF